MRARVLTLSLLMLLAPSLSLIPQAAAAATPQFYETTVIKDADTDYASQAGYDIQNVYVGEKHSYDSEKGIDQGAQLNFRIELAGASIPCGSNAGYDVTFDAGAGPKTVTARAISPPPSDQQHGCGFLAGAGSGPTSIIGNSIVLVVSEATLGISPGATLKSFSATSYAVAGGNPDASGGNPVPQDLAPYDNKNVPTPPNQAPDANPLSVVASGGYPFIVVNPVTPLHQYSVGGAEIKYDFSFVSDPGLKDDNVRVKFDVPKDWTIAPSQGKTGSDPEGQLGTSGGTPRDFFFTLSATGLVNEGDTATVGMRVYTDSGGFANITTVTTVTGPKITDPSLTLALKSLGPFKASKESLITFSATTSNGTLDAAQFAVDVMQDGKKVGQSTAKSTAPGEYQANFTFPSAGNYVLDIYEASMKPSPHQEFPVTVAKGGLSPAPGLGFIALGLVAAMAAARRRHA